MPTDILFSTDFSRADLDRHLAQGWRPLGQRVYRCDWLQLEPGLITSVLPTRLSLDQYRPGKRMQKLWRRSHKKFRVVVGEPAHISIDKERVNNLYGLVAPDKKLEQLDYHLLFQGEKMLDTRECRIYDGEELVAFSWFDCGELAMYSKVGIYHPAYAKHSLGIFSMLLEIQYAIDQGMTHYYPGYVSPQNPSFDYKHRIGELEYFDPVHQQWRDWSEFSIEQEHLSFLLQKLLRVRAHLKKEKVLSNLMRYPFYSLRLHEEFVEEGHLLDSPLVLFLEQKANSRYYVIIFELHSQSYRLVQCYSDRYVPAYFTNEDGSIPITHRILFEQRTLLVTKDVAHVSTYWKKMQKNLS